MSDDLKARVQSVLPGIRADLEDLVRIESVSADPARAGEVQRISLDASRAEELLGWRPTKSLEEGLRLTLDAV